MAVIDLHAHSTASDGVLSPSDLVARAAARGVHVLALTDHDTLAGLTEAARAGEAAGMRIVPGCEISASFGTIAVHVVGLQIDPESAPLCTGLAQVRTGRAERARRMARSLEEAGVAGAYEGGRQYVTDEHLLSRTHFARFLVERGHAPDVARVFRRFLVPGKPGYVAHRWATLSESVGWIKAAGGHAVLAHPGRYRLTRTGMRRLLAEFRDCGGDALEVVSSSHTSAQYEEYATHARVFGLRASLGSDYHAPDESWMELGGLPRLPAGTIPVWQDW